MLSKIGTIHQQAAYTCYTSGYQQKFSYYLRTIPGIEMYLDEVELTIRHIFILAITGGLIVNDDEKTLLPLPPRLGGLGIKILTETAPIKFTNSMNLTKKLQNEIKRTQTEAAQKTIQQVKGDRRTNYNIQLSTIKEKMTHEQRRLNESNRESGASNWLTSLPLKDLGYDLNKQQF